MMREKKHDVSTLTAAALMAAVLCVLGPLSVPIGPVPIAMANFAVSLAAWLLGPRGGGRGPLPPLDVLGRPPGAPPPSRRTPP